MPTIIETAANHLAYPNESAAYRQARNALLDDEIALRAQIEAVAAKRRALPPGGQVPEDYIFERIGDNGMPERVAMSQLFGRHRTLILYSFMYGPDRERPCPGCTQVLDGLDAAVRHAAQRAAIYVVAKSPLARLLAWARQRQWDRLQFVSTAGNSYDADYFGDTSKLPPALREALGLADGENWDETIFNVFSKDNGTIRHFWGSEMRYAPKAPKQDHRAGDLATELWGLLDITPEGRGDFTRKLHYDLAVPPIAA